MKLKRKPTLADMFLATSKKHELFLPHFHETTVDNLRQAHRFVIDDEAIRYIGEMIRDMPRIIADAQDFAIPPFQKTWIEFNARLLFRTITGIEPDPNGDENLGYLIVGPVVRVIAGMDDGTHSPEVLPLQYKMFQPWSLDEELKFSATTRISRLNLDAMFWGSTAGMFLNERDKVGLRALRENHSMELCCKDHYKEHIMDQLAVGQAGDLRNVIAILLFLNRMNNDIYERHVPLAQTVIRARTAPLLKHTVITIKLNPIPKLRKLCAGEGVWRRLHDVRGHYCHNKEARYSGCMHEWEETRPLHWECTLKCGGMRWWRHEHKRGHEEKGIVTSEYKVTE
jgi:hypothetical protein